MRFPPQLLVLPFLTACGVGPMRLPPDPPKDTAAPGAAQAVNSEHLDVRFARKDVLRVVHDPALDKLYPDLITFRGSQEPERGLVLETDLKTVLVRLPRKAYRRGPTGEPGAATRFTGRVEGRVVRRGKPVRNCEVRLTALRYETRMLIFTGVVNNDHQETVVTDRDGLFSFGNLPPGPYRLAFRRRKGKSWLLRIRPGGVDAVVENRTVPIGDVDLGKRVLD